MQYDDVIALRDVDTERFVVYYLRASEAVDDALRGDRNDRWRDAAEQVCALLDFVSAEDALWAGLHGAVDGTDGTEADLHRFRDMMDEFVSVETELLRRSGLSDGAAQRIVYGMKIGLLSFEQPSHGEIDALRSTLDELRGAVCGSDFGRFMAPEQTDRVKQNCITAVQTTSGLIGVVVDAVTTPAVPLFAASIVGGMMGALTSVFGWRRRR